MLKYPKGRDTHSRRPRNIGDTIDRVNPGDSVRQEFRRITIKN